MKIQTALILSTVFTILMIVVANMIAIEYRIRREREEEEKKLSKLPECPPCEVCNGA